jgi:hypothetical protein
MVAALHADPETSVWTKEKGEPNGQRELKRIWDKIDPEKERPESTLVTEDSVATWLRHRSCWRTAVRSRCRCVVPLDWRCLAAREDEASLLICTRSCSHTLSQERQFQGTAISRQSRICSRRRTLCTIRP